VSVLIGVCATTALDAASPTWDEDLAKMIEKVRILKEREKKKTEEDRLATLRKATEVSLSRCS